MSDPKPEISVHAVGTKILMADAVPGQITCISIRESSVRYEVVWWDGMARNTQWVEEFEFVVVDDNERLKIGFR